MLVGVLPNEAGQDAATLNVVGVAEIATGLPLLSKPSPLLARAAALGSSARLPAASVALMRSARAEPSRLPCTIVVRRSSAPSTTAGQNALWLLIEVGWVAATERWIVSEVPTAIGLPPSR
jgi:hypothetical protein